MLSVGNCIDVFGTDYSEIVWGDFCRGTTVFFIHIWYALGPNTWKILVVRGDFDSVKRLERAEKEVTRQGATRWRKNTEYAVRR